MGTLRSAVVCAILFVASVASEAKDHRPRSTKLILNESCNKTFAHPLVQSSDLTVRLIAPTTHADNDDDEEEEEQEEHEDDDDENDDDEGDGGASSYYCWTRFEGSDNQCIEFTINELRLGPESCLRISDQEQESASDWSTQTTILCGSRNESEGKARIRRRTSSPFALVEFKYNKVKPEGLKPGFEYDATFVNKEEYVERLPYGHGDRREGRISNTKCDWLIKVDECVGFCSVISPGYPGVYPPNTRCRYHFENSENLRVELKFGGKHFGGVFDLRESNNCEEDYVEVYDGQTEVHPLIGRFCGRAGAHLISSGSYFLMIFQSGRGKDAPFNYTGFSMQIKERWNYHNDPNDGGLRKPNSTCDLVFQSFNAFFGDLHTPDYFLSAATNCTYEFHGVESYRERIEFTLVTQKTSHRDGKTCLETLAAYDGATEVRRFCLDRDGGGGSGGGQDEYVWSTTSHSAYLRYHKAAGQTSNPDPPWISFQFFRLPRSNAVQTPSERKEGSTTSAGGRRLSLNPATDPDYLIARRPLSTGVQPSSADANTADRTNQFQKTTTSAHRTAMLVAVACLIIRGPGALDLLLLNCYIT